ncbi:hypothetical protein D9M70_362390 [compost metagenome]
MLATVEQPVDRALFVGLQVILEEVVAEVASQGVTARFGLFRREVVGEKAQVGFEVGLVPGHRDKLDQAVGRIVGKPLFIVERQDAVGIGREAGVAAGVEAMVTAVSVDQAGLIETVAAENATDGVGHHLPHAVFTEARPQLIFSQLASVAVGRVYREGNLLNGDVGAEVVCEAIGIDKETVILLFEALHLCDGGAILGGPGNVTGLKSMLGSAQNRVELEVPGALKCVPVCLRDSDCSLTAITCMLIKLGLKLVGKRHVRHRACAEVERR